FRRNDMPFGPAEKDALQKQALHAKVSSEALSQLFEDPEMKILFSMLRTTAPDIIPTGKVVRGHLLNEAAEEVELNIMKALKDHTDGRKSLTKDAVNALCVSSYLLELIEVTALKKDGPSQCKQFAEMIDRIEEKHGCIVIYFTTDADGGSKKGRVLLGKRWPWIILPPCWAHQFQLILGDYFKVNDAAAIIAEEATTLIGWINNHSKVGKIFDESQHTISKDRNAGKIIILAYLVANLTHWTTHFVVLMWLFILCQALHLAVLQNRTAIIAAEVRAATSKEATQLTEDAEKYCNMIEDSSFWNGLETVLGDLEPICLGKNINQKDSTWLDQVLLTITGIFLRFAEHPEEEVQTSMLVRLEKHWKDCDQPVFIMVLVLNPFERLSCFRPNVNLNQLKCCNLLISLYRCMQGRPDNMDTPAQKTSKGNELSKVFMQYLAGTGDFADVNIEHWEEYNLQGNLNPIKVWESLVDSRHLAKLCRFTIKILKIIANQAGCECTFSRTKIHAQIRSNHEQHGLVKSHEGQKNHKSTATLLSVPRYRDLLEDQDDEDLSERGRALVSSPDGWRVQMAKW
ncbi:ribonuclease H-like domain-containing protein, partial [Mycena sp. CBHHK59/15]